jgi:hypothetical protein
MTGKKTNAGTTLEFGQTLWLAVDKLREHMDAASHCHPELAEGSLISAADGFHRDLHKPSASGAESDETPHAVLPWQTPRAGVPEGRT